MTQCGQILDYLMQGHTITQAEAITLFGCYRLGARIYDIKGQGFDIRREMEQGTNRFGEPVRYARYWLKNN